MGLGEDLEGGREGAVEEMDPNETVSPLLPRPRPRRATTASDIAHRRSTSMVLFGLVLFTMRQTMPGLDQSGAGMFGYNSGSANSPGRVLSKRAVEDPDVDLALEDPSLVQLGRIFAWICTVFYLSSRMPQLWKNFTRKSVQGLSILMFFWAAMGNLTYTLSILNSADALNPETRRTFLLASVPYVLGSSGTLMFDVSIFCQWLYYTGKLRVLGLRPGGKSLKPLSMATIPGAILDVVQDDTTPSGTGLQEQNTSQRASLETTFPTTTEPVVTIAASTLVTVSTAGRNPSYGLVEAAMENYAHMDRPNFSARSPQFAPETLDHQPLNLILTTTTLWGAP
ncbi:hypothetical protein EC991_006012 [Linnemannia zychae]|nr:hypothetical protein EC991_006012 [Linnemannia zychae]